MHARKSLLLAVLLVALASYVYFFELSKTEKGKAEKLIDFSEDEVEGVLLQDSQQQIRLRKEPSGKWRLISPVQASADESTVAGVLSALRAAEVIRILTETPTTEDLNNYGLAQPRKKVSITLKSGLALAPILIGDQTPVGQSVYVRRENKPQVLLTSAVLSSSLQRGLNDFRDKGIIDFETESVTRLRLRGTQGTIELIKKDDGWSVSQPGTYRADPDEVRDLLGRIRSMVTEDFLAGGRAALEAYGLDRPELQIVLFFGAGQREISFGKRKEGKDSVYLTVDSEPTIYSARADVLKNVNKDLFTLRDKRMISFPIDRVSEIHIQTAKDSVRLLKEEKLGWVVESAKTGTTHAEAVNDYLEALGLLRAVRFIDRGEKEIGRYGLAQPAIKISLHGEKGKQLETLLVGEKTGPDVYAKLEGDPTVYGIEESSYQRLFKQRRDFLNAPAGDSSSREPPRQR